MKLSDASAVKVRSANASAVYVGRAKVWPAGPQLVQHIVPAGDSSNAYSFLIPSPVAGNLLIVAICGFNSELLSVTDNTGGVWAAISNRESGSKAYLFSKVSAGNETSIQTSSTKASTWINPVYQEWSGAAGTLVPAGGSYAYLGYGTSFTFTTAPPSVGGIPIVSIGFESRSAPVGISAPWLMDVPNSNAANNAALAYKTDLVTAAQSGTFRCAWATLHGAWVAAFIYPK